MTDNRHETVIVERRGSASGLLIGFALLVLVTLGAFFVINKTKNDNIRTEAVASAAKDVGDSAKGAGDAVEKAADPGN